VKKTIFSAAVIAAALGASAPAQADGWTDAFSESHVVRRVDKGQASEGRSRFSGRSNLGVMTSDDDVRPTARSRRASRSAAAAEAREERRSRRASRVTTTAYSGGGGGSSGIASYYWQPQRVASGGWFNPNAMTAAHKTLPFGTRVRVTNGNTGRSAVVTINDRGPYVAGRVIDLSKAAASSVGMIGSGLARVRMEVLGR
jgi:rare lipoprotein A